MQHLNVTHSARTVDRGLFLVLISELYEVIQYIILYSIHLCEQRNA